MQPQPIRIRADTRNRRTKLTTALAYFRPYLGQTILDVGCDRRHLEKLLPHSTWYLGVDFAGEPDLRVNLEHGLPLQDHQFDTVLCFDVLEHLESIHAMFDELCRVSRRYVIIGLPNTVNWRTIAALVLHSRVPGGKYKLTEQRPDDRHRWFFGIREARAFVHRRAELQHFHVQMETLIDWPSNRPWLPWLERLIALKDPFLIPMAYWVVLEKNEPF